MNTCSCFSSIKGQRVLKMLKYSKCPFKLVQFELVALLYVKKGQISPLTLTTCLYTCEWLVLTHGYETLHSVRYLWGSEFVYICSTWGGQVQLCPPELRHRRLQLLDYNVILKEKVFGQRLLQKLHQVLHGQLHHVLCGPHTHTSQVWTVFDKRLAPSVVWSEVLLLCILRMV